MLEEFCGYLNSELIEVRMELRNVSAKCNINLILGTATAATAWLAFCPSKNMNVRIHRTIILPVVLYGYETWSLTLREEHRWRVSENRVLRRICGPKTYKETGGWMRNLVTLTLRQVGSQGG
jgi:hypothetical protein